MQIMLLCRVKVSALALLKMVMHARSGGRIEVCIFTSQPFMP